MGEGGGQHLGEDPLGWSFSLPLGSSKNRSWFDITNIVPLFAKFSRFKDGNGLHVRSWEDVLGWLDRS